jgi:hypothetical protein
MRKFLALVVLLTCGCARGEISSSAKDVVASAARIECPSGESVDDIPEYGSQKGRFATAKRAAVNTAERWLRGYDSIAEEGSRWVVRENDRVIAIISVLEFPEGGFEVESTDACEEDYVP